MTNPSPPVTAMDAIEREADEAVTRLCKMHEKMLAAIQRQRPYPVQQRIGEADTDTILNAAVVIERLKALKLARSVTGWQDIADYEPSDELAMFGYWVQSGSQRHWAAYARRGSDAPSAATHFYTIPQPPEANPQ